MAVLMDPKVKRAKKAKKRVARPTAAPGLRRSGKPAPFRNK